MYAFYLFIVENVPAFNKYIYWSGWETQTYTLHINKPMFYTELIIITTANNNWLRCQKMLCSCQMQP